MFDCPICPRGFNSERALEQHQDAKDHYEQVGYDRGCYSPSPPPNYCSDCDRTFQSENNLRQHLHSRTHQGQNLECPFCQTRFTTASGMTHHVERGACPNARYDRDSLYRFVRSKDENGVISKNLLEWEESTYVEATDRAWNGHSFECYLCRRQFRSLHGLNQHLSSPYHQQPLYHCPEWNCRMDFKTLAALINHFESESCGFIRFGRVQLTAQTLIGSNRRLGF